MVNTKRIIVATILGVVCGIFCAYGTKEVLPEFTMLMLLGVVYNRMLIGLLIGFADEIELHPAVRGGIIGVIVSVAMGLFGGFLPIVGFGLVYGVLIDLVTSKVV